MQFYHGKSEFPIILIHGGAGDMDPRGEQLEVASREILELGDDCIKKTLRDESPVSVVAYALAKLEDSPTFNAGIGSCIQRDGEVRVTSAIMNGEELKFSAVHGLTHIRNPSKVALELQNRNSRVLGLPGCRALAEELGLVPESLITQERHEAWKAESPRVSGCDTVGCIVLSKDGKMAAGTSTGGRGNEFPGRMSDSGTVAGNYASFYAAVSATGLGEQIVEDAVAARLETRVRDGLSLDAAAKRCYDEAIRRARQYGWIAADRLGHWSVAFTTSAMTFAVIGPSGPIKTSLKDYRY